MTPFQLRLINGMSKTTARVTVEINRIVRDQRNGTFNLHIGRILEVKHWDRRREEPR